MMEVEATRDLSQTIVHVDMDAFVRVWISTRKDRRQNRSESGPPGVADKTVRLGRSPA